MAAKPRPKIDVEILVNPSENEISFVIRGDPRSILTPQEIVDAVSEAVLIEYGGLWGDNSTAYDS